MATRLISDRGEVSYKYSHHSDLAMVLSEVLCDDYADCHAIGQG